MKKRLCSILLVLVMAISLLPTAAFAAGGDFDVDIVATKFSAVKYNEKETMKLDFMMRTSNGAKIRGIQTALLAVDLSKFDVVYYYSGTVYDGTSTICPEGSTGSDTSGTFAYSTYMQTPLKKINGEVVGRKTSSTGFLSMNANATTNEYSFDTSTSMMSILLGLKDGAEWSALPSNSVRLATAAEANTFNATGVVTVNDSDGKAFVFRHKDGAGSDTLTIAPTLASDDSFTFVAPPKPAYTGTQAAAPTAASNSGGKIVLTTQTISGETVEYAKSAVGTTNAPTDGWQDSTEFSGLTVSTAYTFWARVKATDGHAAGTAAKAEITAQAAALTSISITGNATADVPTKGNTTTVTLTATGKYDDSSTDNITTAATWTVDSAYAGVSVSKGVVTIAPEAAAGSVIIKAAYNGKESSHTINLNKAPATLTKLTISGDGSIHITNSTPVEKTYTVSGEDQYGESISTGSITWGIDGTTAPTGVSIGTSDGKLKVENTVSVDSVTIKATSGAIFATKTVSITKAASAVETVTIGGGVPSLDVPRRDTLGAEKKVAATAAFTATLQDQYGAPIPGTVTWSVSGNSGVTIDSTSGLLTISSSATDAAVIVTATAENSKKGTANVTITKAPSAATFVQVKKGGTVVTTDSIIIPASGSAATTVTYTAEVYDQYGEPYTSDTPAWSIPTTTGVSVSAGTVSVDSTATAGNVTLTATSSKDSSKTAAVTITLSSKPAHNIGSFTPSSVSITYGDPITGQTVTCSTGGTVQYESSDETIVSVDASTGALTVHKAGNVTITAKVAADPTHAAASTSYTVTVGKKQLEITGLTATNRTYEPGNQSVTLAGGTLSGQVGADDVSVTLPATGTMTDADAGSVKSVNVTTPTLTGTDAGNYTLKPISGITVKIDQATPNVGNVSYAGTGTIYTSTDLSTITLGMDGSAVGSGNLALTTGQTLTVGTKEYNWTFTPSDTTNYKTVNGQVSLTVEEDALVSIAASGTLSKNTYKWGDPFEIAGVTITATYASTTTKDVTAEVEFSTTLAVGQTKVEVTYQGKKCDITGITVKKADALTSLPAITVSQKHTVATEQSKDIGTAGMPEDAGNLTYAAGSASSTGGSASVTASVTGRTVKFTITGGANGEVITLPVTITSDNYENSTVNVVITLTAKDTPSVTANNITVTYDGNPIPVSKITGTATFGGTPVPGTWAWKAGMAVTNVADSGNKTVVFKPTDSANYAEVEKTINVTINKATPTGAPKYTAITTSGKTLADAALTVTGGTFSVPGTVKWVDDAGADLADTTPVTANTYYKWLFTPTDTANYNTHTGSIKLYAKSSGGGGGSYTPSYSITVDKTENGTITVSPKSASKGDTVTITVKPDKGYELEMLKALDKDGDALKLTEKNGKYTFKMPSGKVTVKGSFVEEAPVQIFKDVPVDAYYYEAVKWAAEKGITGGVGNGLFAPNQPCTRAQIVTFLWRAAGSPAPKNMSSFVDVPADAFYAKAVAWAVENGITGGTGDGKFSPDATCTRAQAVTFLYRAAGSPKVSGSAEFGDVATNAYYADAVAWAAKNGITGGIGGGLFGSGNDCTRAQIVTFLYRSVK